MVADGAPFCSSCRAPQIRFVVPEPPEAVLTAHVLSGEAALINPTRLLWSKALYSAFLGGVFSALFMNFLGGLLGLGFIAGGIIAVYAYRRRAPEAVLGLGSGVQLGALSGLLGFVVFGVLVALEVLLTKSQGRVYGKFLDFMNQTAQNADPQVQQQIQEMIQQFKTPAGFVLTMIIMGVSLCAIFVFFSILGGAIGSSMTRRKRS